MSNDEYWMQLALEQAQQAQIAGEVPVGAVLVRQGQLVAAAGNAQLGSSDPSAHAEICCLRKAAAKVGNYRLPGCELFVTLEPCAMCAGAIVHARIQRLVFAAAEPKAGAVCSRMRYLDAPWLNHRVRVDAGVLEQPCAELLSGFFAQRRRPAES